MANFFTQLFKVAIFSSVAVVSVLVTLFIGLLFTGMAIAGLSGSGSSEGAQLTDREFVAGDKSSKNELLVINVTGVIMGDRETQDSWLTGLDTGVTYGYEVKEELIKAAEEDDIKGVLLYINSPGGTIFGSEAIADGVTEYKQITGKPVIAFVSGMAASGGYWSALAADEIYADTGSTIGSIGVIFGPFKYYDSVISEDGGAFVGGVVTENGIQNTYITAGRSKDLGNPYRKLSPEEITSLQSMVNQSYSDFVGRVAAARKIEPATIINSIGALVYSEHQAVDLKLIDGILNKQEAYTRLAEKAGVKDNYKVSKLVPEPNFFNTLLSASSVAKSPSVAVQPCKMSTLVLAYHGDIQTVCQQ